MNPFKRIKDWMAHWNRGAPEERREMPNTVATDLPVDYRSTGLSSFLDVLRGRKKKITSEVTYVTCLKMLSESLAKMPIKYYERTEDGIIEAKETATSRLLTYRPNPFMSPTVFWNTVEMNRNHYGNAYVYIRWKIMKQKYGGEYQALDLWIMQSNAVQIIVDNEGIFGGAGRIWYVYTDPITGKRYLFNTDEVMHFKTSFSFDGITGIPVQAILRETIYGAAAAQDYMNNMYESGLTAKAVLEFPGEVSSARKEEIVKTFENFGAGAKNTGKIIPVPIGMKLTPLDIKLSDSQFFELKKYSALQIAGAMGIKPNQINDYTKSSYANSEMQNVSFYVDTMLYIIKQYEEEINYKMEGAGDNTHFYKFNEKVLFRTDSKTQMEYLKAAVDGSVMKPNEARKKLDMPKAEGGDTLLANGSMVPLPMAGIAYQKNDSSNVVSEPEQPGSNT